MVSTKPAAAQPPVNPGRFKAFDKEGLKISETAKNIRFTGLLGRELAVTIKGQIITFGLTDAALARLKDSVEGYFNCFREAERITMERSRAAYAQAAKPQTTESASPPPTGRSDHQ